MGDQKPLILVTNDDGVYAPGIYALFKAMSELGDVRVVAPESERSAVGHALTMSDPLRVWEVDRYGDIFGHAVNGTPADCVKLAVKAILQKKPDLVVSGINQGPNTAINVIYSGTVSAATEGTLMGIPSIAFSLASFSKSDFDFAARFARHLAYRVLQDGVPQGTLLNVNIPALPEDQILGVKITRQGQGRYEEYFEKRVDPMNRNYFWLAGKKLQLDNDSDVDDVAVMEGYIAITPIQFDLTDYKALKNLQKWEIGLPR
ncbi:MAG: 5'/3'-nucleotidase SurE [Calditrichaeota bacterium]|nr:5'/3'-nucleotidase SurE [Calditrichota bacterium]